MQSMTTIRTIPTVIQLKPTTLDFHSGALLLSRSSLALSELFSYMGKKKSNLTIRENLVIT